jgi:hypothetical protein
MIFFVRFSSSTTFSSWQPKNAQQTLDDKLVGISNLQHYQFISTLKHHYHDSLPLALALCRGVI